MTVSITSVPSTTRKPGFYGELNTSSARQGLPVLDDKLLFVGTLRTTGTTTAEELVQVRSSDEAKTLFGYGSPIAHMIEAALEENPYIAEIWACPLAEDGSGVAASGTVTFAASSLTDGVLTFWVGRRRVRLDIDSADSASAICTAFVAAMQAEEDLPFSFAVNGGTPEQADYVAKVKGTHGNDWILYAEFSGSGLTSTIVQPTSGANDADIADALAVAEPEQFDLVVSEYNDATSLAALKAHLNTVSGPLEQRPGTGYAGFVGSLGNATTLGSGVNSGRVSVAYLRNSRTHPMELAAGLAAEVVRQEDRALPLNTVVMGVALPPDDPADKLSRADQESCLANGVTPLMVDGLDVRIVRWVTTYIEDAGGSPDDALLDGMTIRVLDYTRYAVRIEVQQQLGQAKLASVARTPRTTDPNGVRALILGVLLRLEGDLGYLQNVEANAERLVVELDGSVAGRVNAEVPAAIVPGLHVTAASFNLIL